MFDGLEPFAKSLAGLIDLPDVATLDARLFGPLRADLTRPFEHALEVQSPRASRRSLRERTPKALESLYDVRITEAKRIPTRERSWHDLMNALVFSAFPASKIALHARHALELAAHFKQWGQLPNARSRLQDMLALLDEGGVLLVGNKDVLDEVRPVVSEGRARDLVPAIGEGKLRAIVFGHAILEHELLGAPLPRAAVVLLEDCDPLGGRELILRLDQALATFVDRIDPRTASAPNAPGLDVAPLFQR